MSQNMQHRQVFRRQPRVIRQVIIRQAAAPKAPVL